MEALVTFDREILPEVGLQAGLNERFVFGDLPAFVQLGQSVKEHRGFDTDSWALGNSQFRKWAGHLNFDEILHRMQNGNEALAARSDDLLRDLETAPLLSRAFKIVDDVAGAVPNVPAYIAGQPLAMRRRARTMSEQAPLAVVVNLSSHVDILDEQLMARGAAILALVRQLSTVRPVELWCGSSLGARLSDVSAIHQYVRIETSPLDLARAAFVIVATAFSRGFLQRVANYTAKFDYMPAYGNNTPKLDIIGSRLFAGALPSMPYDALFIGRAHRGQKLITEPKKWLADQLAAYAPTLDSAA